jgi:hypothetical protein
MVLEYVMVCRQACVLLLRAILVPVFAESLRRAIFALQQALTASAGTSKLTVRIRNQLQMGEVAGLNLQRQPCVGPVPVWRPSSLPPSSPKRNTRREGRAVSADKLISALTTHFQWLNPIVTRRLPDARRGMEGTCRTSKRVPSPSTLATWRLNKV